MINEIKKYIEKCPYLDELNQINVEFLKEADGSYAIHETEDYDPLIKEDLCGNKELQYLFNFDAKFTFGENNQKNIENSLFFEKFKSWLEENNDKEIFPSLEGIEPISIGVLTNGYIKEKNTDKAIYRINCKFTYIRRRNV